MSKIWRPFGLACLAAASLLIMTSAVLASSEPSVRVTSAVGQGVVRLSAKASGPFDYVVHHPSTDLYYIDMTGVSASNADVARVLGNDLVRSYRLEQYQSGDHTVSRIELLLGEGAVPKITREGSDALKITVSKKSFSSAESQESAEPRLVNASFQTPAPANSAIRQISVVKNGDVSEVIVSGSGTMDCRQLRLHHPSRLVLDFQSERMSAPKKTASNIEPIRDVRAAQFSPQVARVVIDLTKDSSYSVKHVDGGVAIEFASAEPAQSASASSDSASAAPSTTDASAPAPSAPPLASDAASTSTDANSAQAPAQPSAASANTGASASASPASTDTSSTSAQAAQPSASPANADSSASTSSAAPESSNFPKTTAPMSASATQATAEPAGFSSPVSGQAAPATASQDPKPVTPAAAAPSSAAPAPSASAPAADAAATQSAQAAQSAPQQAAPPTQEAMPAQAAPAASITPVSAVSVVSQDQTGGKYTGAPISVNLKNVDLQDFFRLIHEISGLNVVVDPNVKGTLTLVLDNVPWDQALDIVLKNNDLGDQLDGNVLRIATKATMQKEAEEAKDLAKAQVEAADLVTTTRTLSYAKASDVVDTLKKFLSPRGVVLADNRTNTLVISDIPTVLPVVDNLIRELDTKTQQVEIEARVVAANRSFARELGSQFAFAGSATGGRNLFSGLDTVGASPINRSVPPLPAPPVIVGSAASGSGGPLPLVTNLGATVPTSGVAYAFSSANFALDYVISAAESKGVGKLLSKPKEIVQNNEQATIKQGTKIPVQTVINNTITVQFIDAVLELQVTPQITKDGTIFMTIHVENTQIDPAIPRIQGIPALDTQAQDTRVLVRDGQTVMIGGIIISNQQTSIDEVPFVGSLPIIGQLFRHTTISTNSQELLFFVTPRILPM
ncbi:MAG TPA: type IV pilus secretin PilQ [Candidatus Acidoferrales bacterium]|nr:type IV pilus secretin PilQ [Candidatus Acidoferrales bacterium]